MQVNVHLSESKKTTENVHFTQTKWTTNSFGVKLNSDFINKRKLKMATFADVEAMIKEERLASNIQIHNDQTGRSVTYPTYGGVFFKSMGSGVLVIYLDPTKRLRKIFTTQRVEIVQLEPYFE